MDDKTRLQRELMNRKFTDLTISSDVVTGYCIIDANSFFQLVANLSRYFDFDVRAATYKPEPGETKTRCAILVMEPTPAPDDVK